MKAKKTVIVGWVLSGLVAAFFAFSASGKLTEWEGKAEMFDHLGYSTDVMFNIGVVELAIAILFVIPRTGFLAAVLLTAYLGGATATHARVGDPFFMPILIGVFVWVAFGLRRPEVFLLAVDSPAARPKPAEKT